MSVRSFLEILKVFIIVTLILAFGLICLTFGRHQAEDWNVTNKHLKMESNGYNYCPYCGKSLEEGK